MNDNQLLTVSEVEQKLASLHVAKDEPGLVEDLLGSHPGLRTRDVERVMALLYLRRGCDRAKIGREMQAAKKCEQMKCFG